MIKPKKSLGQNFLTDQNILKKIVGITKIEKKSVLEVCPGTGNLTSSILKNNPKNFFLIEKDESLISRAKQAALLFPSDSNIQGLYRTITVGQGAVNKATAFSNAALALFNQADYANAAINFEKAIAQNPLEYS